MLIGSDMRATMYAFAETAGVACLLAWADPSTESVAHAGHACDAVGFDYLSAVCACIGTGTPPRSPDEARKAVAVAVIKAGARMELEAMGDAR